MLDFFFVINSFLIAVIKFKNRNKLLAPIRETASLSGLGSKDFYILGKSRFKLNYNNCGYCYFGSTKSLVTLLHISIDYNF